MGAYLRAEKQLISAGYTRLSSTSKTGLDVCPSEDCLSVAKKLFDPSLWKPQWDFSLLTSNAGLSLRAAEKEVSFVAVATLLERQSPDFTGVSQILFMFQYTGKIH